MEKSMATTPPVNQTDTQAKEQDEASTPGRTPDAEHAPQQTVENRIGDAFRGEGGSGNGQAASQGKLRNRLARMFRWGRKGEPVEVAVARREASLLQLKRGYNEVADTLTTVRRHMDEQADRSERMIQLMEGLPDLLRTLPEHSASQTRILEGIAESMKAQQQTSERLGNALATATESQKQVSTHLKQQLDASNQSSREMREALTGLSSTLGDVNRSNESTRSAFIEGSQQTRDLFARTQKMMAVLTAVTALVAAAAIGALIYMIVTVAGLNSQPAVSTPGPAAPVVTPAE
jgi:bacterioferritin (cytochrome b1)